MMKRRIETETTIMNDSVEENESLQYIYSKMGLEWMLFASRIRYKTGSSAARPAKFRRALRNIVKDTKYPLRLYFLGNELYIDHFPILDKIKKNLGLSLFRSGQHTICIFQQMKSPSSSLGCRIF